MGTANRMDVRVVGDTKSLVAEMRAVEKENARLEARLTRLAKTGSKSGKAISKSYAGARKRAAQLDREIKHLTFSINKKGQATAKETMRLGRLNKALSLTQQKLRGVDRAGRGASRSLATGTGNALKFVGALVGIGSAVGVIMLIASRLKQEYQHLVDQQRRAKIEQMTTGEARAIALWNKPADMPVGRLDKLVEETSKRKGYEIDPKRLWRLAASLLSGKGKLKNKQFEAAFKEASRFGAIAGEGFETDVLGGVTADIMKVTGQQDAKRAVGWFRQIGLASRVVAMEKQAKSITPVISSAKPLGFTEEQSAELFAYISHRSGDVEGRLASTGAINLMKWVKSLQTKGTLKQGGIEGLRELQTKFAAASDTEKRLLLQTSEAEGFAEYVSMSKKQRQKLMGKIPGRAKTLGAMLGLLTRAPGAMAEYARAREQITAPTSDEAAKAAEQYFKDVKAGEYEEPRAIERKGKSVSTWLKLKNVKGARAGALRELVDKVLADVPGVSKTELQLGKLLQEFKSGVGTKGMYDATLKRIESVRSRRGYGYKYRTAGGRFVEELPEGTVEGKEFFTGSKTYRVQKGNISVPYYENRDYNLQQAEAFADLIQAIKDLKDEFQANRNADDPQPVKIVNTPVINPNAQIESD
ncbi:MAG: hypothetical protein KAV00_10515 [Phycisphaerae bacterium]|nr:hypothetical protein [Phycisphaerae bacterium]